MRKRYFARSAAGQRRPAVGEGGARGGDGAADLLGRALAYDRERLLVAGGDGLVRLGGLEPLAADELPVALADLHDVARLGRTRIRPVGGDSYLAAGLVQLTPGPPARHGGALGPNGSWSVLP